MCVKWFQLTSSEVRMTSMPLVPLDITSFDVLSARQTGDSLSSVYWNFLCSHHSMPPLGQAGSMHIIWTKLVWHFVFCGIYFFFMLSLIFHFHFTFMWVTWNICECYTFCSNHLNRSMYLYLESQGGRRSTSWCSGAPLIGSQTLLFFANCISKAACPDCTKNTVKKITN